MRDQAQASRFKPMEFIRTLYRYVSEAGTDIETVLKQEYWVHLARSLRPGDEIIVVCEDDSYRLHLEVADCGDLWARMRELGRWEWGVEKREKVAPASDAANPKASAPEYKRIWKGVHDLHCIERVSDGVIVQKGIRDKAEAEKIAQTYAPKAA